MTLYDSGLKAKEILEIMNLNISLSSVFRIINHTLIARGKHTKGTRLTREETKKRNLEIKEMKKNNPKLTQKQIGIKFGLGVASISRILSSE